MCLYRTKRKRWRSTHFTLHASRCVWRRSNWRCCWSQSCQYPYVLVSWCHFLFLTAYGGQLYMMPWTSIPAVLETSSSCWGVLQTFTTDDEKTQEHSKQKMGGHGIRLLLKARDGVEVALTIPNLAFHLRCSVQLVPSACSADGVALGVLC